MPTDAGIGPWTLGKDLISLTLAPVTVTATTTFGSGGTTWTAGTPVECMALVRRLNHQARIQTADIRPITQIQENMVPISTGNTLQLVFLRQANNASGATPSWSSGNVLSAILQQGFYVQVIFTDSHEKYDGFYVITGYESGFDGNAEQVQSVDLAPVAITTGGQVVRTLV